MADIPRAFIAAYAAVVFAIAAALLALSMATLCRWLVLNLIGKRRRMGPPRGSYGLPADHDWRRSFTHENTNSPTGEPPLKLRRSVRLDEGRVQRGNGNGGPVIPKPLIKPMAQGRRKVGPEP